MHLLPASNPPWRRNWTTGQLPRAQATWNGVTPSLSGLTAPISAGQVLIRCARYTMCTERVTVCGAYQFGLAPMSRSSCQNLTAGEGMAHLCTVLTHLAPTVAGNCWTLRKVGVCVCECGGACACAFSNCLNQ